MSESADFEVIYSFLLGRVYSHFHVMRLAAYATFPPRMGHLDQNMASS
jgi:hypothetical protein